tara:strand:+ start:337 stop:1092 length:756 start_codon:yes stop_codon:yes gene_type:complete
MRWHSVFISDCHLGSKHALSKQLLSFLNSLDVNKLFIVGDFIDFWVLKNEWHWDDTSTKIVACLKEKQELGCEVVLLRGNHDEQFRNMSYFNGIKIEEKTVYKTLLNKSFLIWHGDQLDWFQSGFLRYVSNIGSVLYEALMLLNTFFKAKKVKVSQEPKSVSSFFKVSVKQAIEKLSCYKKRLNSVLTKNQLDGVVCGHNHFPKVATLAQDKVYYNCGDWMENCSFLTEDFAGNFKLYRYNDQQKKSELIS